MDDFSNVLDGGYMGEKMNWFLLALHQAREARTGMYHLPVYQFPNGAMCVCRQITKSNFYWQGMNYSDYPTDAIIASDNRVDLSGLGFRLIGENEWQGDYYQLGFIEANPFDEQVIAFANKLREQHRLVSIYDFVSVSDGKGVTPRRCDFFEESEHRWYLRWAVNLGVINDNHLSPIHGIPGGSGVTWYGLDDGHVVNASYRLFWNRVYECYLAGKPMSKTEYVAWADWLKKVRLSTSKMFESSDYVKLRDFPPRPEHPVQLKLNL